MRTLNIELVYFRGCPNVEFARAMIREALQEVGAAPVWVEWDRDSADTPSGLRVFGSPTVLVNGRDVSANDDGARTDATACRVYVYPDGSVRGAPSSRQIVQAIYAGQASI